MDGSKEGQRTVSQRSLFVQTPPLSKYPENTPVTVTHASFHVTLSHAVVRLRLSASSDPIHSRPGPYLHR